MPETTDTIKAKLTPGEFVIRKEAVDMVGLPLLNKINDLPKQGGHSEIDKLINMASMENMKPMYGGGEVKMGYGHGGVVKDNMMGMMGGGMANKPMMGYAHGGMAKNLKPVPEDNPGLGKLPDQVRNRMGYMQEGGSVQDNTATDLMNLLALKELSEQSPEFSMFDADSRGGTILDDDILGISEGNFIPAAGIAKLVRPNFLRKKILGYTPDSPFKNNVLLDRETKAARSAMDKLLELQQKANTQMYGDKSIFYKDQKKELNKLADLARSYFGDDYVAKRINFQEGGEVQDSKPMMDFFMRDFQDPRKKDLKGPVMSGELDPREALQMLLNMQTADRLRATGDTTNVLFDRLKEAGYEKGGEVQDSLMGMMYGGMAKKKKGYGYQDGGEVQESIGTYDDPSPEQLNKYGGYYDLMNAFEEADKNKASILGQAFSRAQERGARALNLDIPIPESEKLFDRNDFTGIRKSNMVGPDADISSLSDISFVETPNVDVGGFSNKFGELERRFGMSPEFYKAAAELGAMRPSMDTAEMESTYQKSLGDMDRGNIDSLLGLVGEARQTQEGVVPIGMQYGDRLKNLMSKLSGGSANNIAGFQEGGMVGPPAPQQNEIMQPGQTPPGTLMGPSEADIEQLRMMQAQGLQDSIQQSIVDKARNSLQLMQLLDSLGGETESIENIGPYKPFLDDGKIYLDQEELPSAEEPSKGDMIRMLMDAGMRVI
jgi:hypothetical protein